MKYSGSDVFINYACEPPLQLQYHGRTARQGKYGYLYLISMEAKLQQLVIDLAISAEEYRKLYSGAAKSVLARARDGRSVRFPAKILQPFVTHSGVRGSFVIQFDYRAKFKGITKL